MTGSKLVLKRHYSCEDILNLSLTALFYRRRTAVKNAERH